MTDLHDLAVEITTYLRQHFPIEQERDRQVFALAEEAGEVQEAYLLWSRGGPKTEVAAELADVIVTAYVTGVVLDIDLAGVQPPAADVSLDAGEHVIDLGAKAGAVVGAYCRWAGMKRRTGPWEDVVTALKSLVTAVYAAADDLDIDLMAAVEAKSVEILARGWRDKPAEVTTNG